MAGSGAHSRAANATQVASLANRAPRSARCRHRTRAADSPHTDIATTAIAGHDSERKLRSVAGNGNDHIAPNTATATTDVHELADLRRRSQSLERWIAGFAHAPQDSRDLMAAVEVEDLIALVDVQLGATRDRADALPLWRQRVALLEDLATIRVGAATLAANDTGATASVAPFNRMN